MATVRYFHAYLWTAQKSLESLCSSALHSTLLYHAFYSYARCFLMQCRLAVSFFSHKLHNDPLPILSIDRTHFSVDPCICDSTQCALNSLLHPTRDPASPQPLETRTLQHMLCFYRTCVLPNADEKETASQTYSSYNIRVHRCRKNSNAISTMSTGLYLFFQRLPGRLYRKMQACLRCENPGS